MDYTAPEILDVSELNLNGDFNTQVRSVLQRVRLTKEQVEALQQLVNDLEHAMQKRWPGSQVYPFGSIVTGLGIQTSDVDCYIQLPTTFVFGKNVIAAASRILRKMPWLFSNVSIVPGAKIPLLKFIHRPTCCSCDANFKSPSGVRNSKLIAFFMNMDSRVLPLMIIIKYWSKVYKFTGTNLMPNYALILMVIFYLQQKDILPSVRELQRDVYCYFVDGWNTAFNPQFHHIINNKESLYDLLGGFFKYYITFNFVSDIISPYLGYPFSKDILNDIDQIPDEYNLYKDAVQNNLCNKIKVDVRFVVQDPFDHSRNCGVAVYPKLFDKIMGHFKYAAKIFEDTGPNDFLMGLFNEGDTISQKEEPSVRGGFTQHTQYKITKSKPKKKKRKLTNSIHICFEEYRKRAKVNHT